MGPVCSVGVFRAFFVPFLAIGVGLMLGVFLAWLVLGLPFVVSFGWCGLTSVKVGAGDVGDPDFCEADVDSTDDVGPAARGPAVDDGSECSEAGDGSEVERSEADDGSEVERSESGDSSEAERSEAGDGSEAERSEAGDDSEAGAVDGSVTLADGPAA